MRSLIYLSLSLISTIAMAALVLYAFAYAVDAEAAMEEKQRCADLQAEFAGSAAFDWMYDQDPSKAYQILRGLCKPSV